MQLILSVSRQAEQRRRRGRLPKRSRLQSRSLFTYTAMASSPAA
jgi:hypothetical protein